MSWSSPARFSGSSILDPDRPEAHPCVPRFSGSGERLAPGGTESGGMCEIDAEGSDIEAVMIRRRPADPANTDKVREDVQARDQLRVDVAFESMNRGSRSNISWYPCRHSMIGASVAAQLPIQMR